MELKNQTTVASVRLFDVVVSESELEVFDSGLAHLLANARDRECYKLTGATREEVIGMQEDIRNVLRSAPEAVVPSPKTGYGPKRKTGTS